MPRRNDIKETNATVFLDRFKLVKKNLKKQTASETFIITRPSGDRSREVEYSMKTKTFKNQGAIKVAYSLFVKLTLKVKILTVIVGDANGSYFTYTFDLSKYHLIEIQGSKRAENISVKDSLAAFRK